MAQYLPLPDGSFVTIRQGETPLQAYERATKEYPEAFGIKPPAPKEGVGAAFQGGLEGLLSRARTGVEAIFDPEEAARRGVERGEAIGQEFAPGASLQRVKDVYAERGLLPAAGEVISQIPSALAEQAPNIAATLASAKLGAMGGTAVAPGIGTVIGGVGGALAPSLLQLFGSNVERQAAEQLEAGRPLDISRGAALAAAAPALRLKWRLPLSRLVATLSANCFAHRLVKLWSVARQKPVKRWLKRACSECWVKARLLVRLSKYPPRSRSRCWSVCRLDSP